MFYSLGWGISGEGSQRTLRLDGRLDCCWRTCSSCRISCITQLVTLLNQVVGDRRATCSPSNMSSLQSHGAAVVNYIMVRMRVTGQRVHDKMMQTSCFINKMCTTLTPSCTRHCHVFLLTVYTYAQPYLFSFLNLSSTPTMNVHSARRRFVYITQGFGVFRLFFIY